MKWYTHEAGATGTDGSYLRIHSEMQGDRIVYVVKCQRPMTDENRKRWVRSGLAVRVVLVGVRARFDEAKALGNKWGRAGEKRR